MIKQDIRTYIYMLFIAGQTGWTDWAEFFCGHSWVAGGCYRVISLKNLYFFQIFLKYFFSTGNGFFS